MSERIPLVPLIPFTVDFQKEKVVLRYFNLLMEGYADWHDDGGERREKIVEALQQLRVNHGEMLCEYLESYRGMRHEALGGIEYCRCRVATNLFETAESE